MIRQCDHYEGKETCDFLLLLAKSLSLINYPQKYKNLSFDAN